MRFLSVCSGIEAASVAWNPLGWHAAAFSEIEPFPCSVLAHHYPSVPNRGDMTKFQEWPNDAIDLLCGGTPCQAFSVAGLRKGLADPRGNLMLTYGAIAAEHRPRWLVWENVPGVLSSDSGRDFGTFLGMLGQLGYGFAYRILDAQHFGVPQRRRRVFVVGCLGDWRAAAAVLFERHSLSGHPAPRRQAGQRPTGTLSARTEGGGGLGTDFDIDGGCVPVAPTMRAGGNKTGGDRPPGTDVDTADSLVIARPLTTSNQRIDAETETETETETFIVAHSLRGEGFDASEDGTGRGTPLVPVLPFDTTQMTSAANRSSPKLGDPCHPLAAGAHPPGIAYSTKLHNTASNNAGKIFEERTACLDANSPPPALLTAMQVRRLTPRECERLQGFPDDYTAVTHRGKPAADGPRYKALGNSWAVPCARWIGERINAVEQITAPKELEAA